MSRSAVPVRKCEKYIRPEKALLPLNGSGGIPGGSYAINERVDPVCAATPEEWATAAHHWLEVAKALTDDEGT